MITQIRGEPGLDKGPAARFIALADDFEPLLRCGGRGGPLTRDFSRSCKGGEEYDSSCDRGSGPDAQGALLSRHCLDGRYFLNL
jgi:hypothetical protein